MTVSDNSANKQDFVNCTVKQLHHLLPTVSSWTKEVMLVIKKIKKYSSWTVTRAIAHAKMSPVSLMVRKYGSLYIEVCAFWVISCWWLTTGDEMLRNFMPEKKRYMGVCAICCSWR